MTAYRLVVVTSDDDWRAYHGIREAELFTARGRLGVYNPNHPHNFLPGHVPLVLRADAVAVAAMRLDLLADARAVIRTMAVVRAEQRKGHGRAFGTAVEEFAASRGVRLLLVNAARDAEGFYRRWGFVPETWDDPLGMPAHFGDVIVQMAKPIGGPFA